MSSTVTSSANRKMERVEEESYLVGHWTQKGLMEQQILRESLYYSLCGRKAIKMTLHLLERQC